MCVQLAESPHGFVVVGRERQPQPQDSVDDAGHTGSLPASAALGY
jgi:hypothetical protein